jgi:hypothetical protein
MAITVQEIFDIAIRLMDAQNESTGSTDTADTKEYNLRTVSLLNSVLDKAYPYSDNYREAVTGGKRPICPKVTSMTDEVQLDEAICTAALPYALAGLLLLEEDPTRANFFMQMFEEMLEQCRKGLPAVESTVEDVYGGIEYGQFGAWL